MKFIMKNKLELGDTLVPDLFIINNMKNLQGNDIKVYIYILYLLKKGDEIDLNDLAKDLDLTDKELKSSLEVLQAEELIIKNSQGYNVIDLKEIEINKSYTPKFETKVNRQSVTEQRRKAAAEAISESSFNGVMTLGWYTDIGNLFKSYAFSEDVMIALFQYCKERRALNKKYVYAVAETWHNGGVKTFEQLENFLEMYDKFTKIKQKIVKALGLRRNLSKYEEVYIKKWIEDYKYEFDIIEQGLKRSTSTTNPSIKYVDAIITSWHNKGYTKVEEIQNEENIQKVNDEKKEVKKVSESKKKSYQSYSQREYDASDDFYDEI